MEERKQRKPRTTKLDWLTDIITNGSDEQKQTIDNLIQEYKDGLELAQLKRQREKLDKKIKKLESK